MTMLETPAGATIEVRERRENYAKFVIEPLERGFGITLGNALRRILLSSIPGAAVTYMKIDGVLHEFSTIPGMVEDTIALMLNLKGLPVKLNTDEPKVLTLSSVSGAREVTAADITPDADVEILDPNYHIATLSAKDAKLSMEIGVEKGRGYVMADRQRNIEHMIGLDPDGLDLLADPQGELHGRRHARRTERRLRSSHARDRDQRFDHAGRCALDRRGDHARAARPVHRLHEPMRSRCRKRRPASGTFRSKRSTCRCVRSTVSSARASRRSPNCST